MVVVDGNDREQRLIEFPPRLLLGALIGAQIESQLRMRSVENTLMQERGMGRMVTLFESLVAFMEEAGLGEGSVSSQQPAPSRVIEDLDTRCEP